MDELKMQVEEYDFTNLTPPCDEDYLPTCDLDHTLPYTDITTTNLCPRGITGKDVPQANNIEQSLSNQGESLEKQIVPYLNNTDSTCVPGTYIDKIESEVKEGWGYIYEKDNEARAIDRSILLKVVEIIPKTEKLKKLLKDEKRYSSKTFYKEYVKKCSKTYYKWKSIYDNWDYLEEKGVKSIRHGLAILEDEAQKRKAELMEPMLLEEKAAKIAQERQTQELISELRLQVDLLGEKYSEAQKEILEYKEDIKFKNDEILKLLSKLDKLQR